MISNRLDKLTHVDMIDIDVYYRQVTTGVNRDLIG